jgi:fumarylacetoacetase
MASFPIHVSDDCPFSLENIPFGIFSYRDSNRRACTAIGEFIVDLSVLEQKGLFESDSFGPSLFGQVSILQKYHNLERALLRPHNSQR